MTDARDVAVDADASTLRLAFVCVQNAGRSQLATALAERERDRRGLEAVEIVTGGTDPADAVHPVVADAMAEAGLDPVDREPRAITPDELAACDVVCTMGCSIDGICPATWRGDARDWDLPDPHGADIETVREIRATIADRVRNLFDELEGSHDE
ncbi:arsenate-mycothiol transferase ArsC [Halovivax ruber]|uniref:arsenate-mycothiol transferase ArsC n=1 Tax=Halovivax ruber TaxID=387341 RepID=UPI001FE15A8A|nr:ArsC family transcriptional regulator [Halovivax ruber]